MVFQLPHAANHLENQNCLPSVSLVAESLMTVNNIAFRLSVSRGNVPANLAGIWICNAVYSDSVIQVSGRHWGTLHCQGQVEQRKKVTKRRCNGSWWIQGRPD